MRILTKVLAATFALCVCDVTLCGRQDDRTLSPAPAFDVVSVRANASGSDRSSVQFLSGRFVATNGTLRSLIGLAYSIPEVMQRLVITGGSERVLSTRFDVTATMPAGTPGSEARLMLRALLRDRFSFRGQLEKRRLDVYALMSVKEGTLGPDIRPSEHSCQTYRAAIAAGTVAPPLVTKSGEPICGPGAPGWLLADGMRETYAGTLANLIERVQAFVDRPIVDRTGLRGYYSWSLRFAPGALKESSLPSLFTAFQEQLGLRLKPENADVEVLVIDAVSMPTPN
jgi:uncharacterized protein (TIGR03435 family)